MADDKIILQIELQDGQIVKAIGNIRRETKKTGEEFEQSLNGKAIKDFKGSVDDLIGTLPATRAFANVISAIPTSFKLAGAAAVAAGIAFKEALDATLSGEKVNAIASQFEILSKNVGIAGQALKQEFIDKAGGLVQADDITQALNKSIIEMGASAQQLGPIFDVALKATSVFGGSAVQNFESLTSAIASGNTKALKNLGIILDTDKVYKEFAASIGTTADKLSLAGKQQALLNAVAEQGGKAFAGIEPTALQATAAFTRFTNAITDVKQGIQSIIASNLGGAFATLFNNMAAAIDSVATRLQASFGSGIDKSIAQQSILKAEIKATEDQILSLQQKTEQGILKNQEPFIANLQSKLASLRVEASAMQDTIDQAAMARASGPEGDNSALVQQTVQAEEDKRRETLLAARLQTREAILAQQLQFETDEAARSAIFTEQKKLVTEQEEMAKAALKKQYQDADLIGTQQYLEAVSLLEQQYAQKRAAIEIQQNEQRKQRAKEVNNVINQSLASGIAQTTQQMTKDLLKGEASFDKFGKSIIGIVGDMAISLGTYAVAQGFVMQALASNPFTSGAATVVAGIALIAIGTALKAFSGEGGGATAGIGGGGGGGVTSVGSDNSQQQEVAQRDNPNTAVNVVINGNVLDRRQTGLEIAAVIAESFDANGTRVIGATA